MTISFDDTWPHLNSFIEVEGEDEDKVRRAAGTLGYKWEDAKFCGAGEIYEMVYGVHPDKLSESEVIRLTFDDPSPFLDSAGNTLIARHG